MTTLTQREWIAFAQPRQLRISGKTVGIEAAAITEEDRLLRLLTLERSGQDAVSRPLCEIRCGERDDKA